MNTNIGVRRVRQILVAGAVMALVAVAAHGVFDMPLRNPIVSGLVWTLLGMAMVAETTGGRTAAPERGERTW